MISDRMRAIQQEMLVQGLDKSPMAVWAHAQMTRFQVLGLYEMAGCEEDDQGGQTSYSPHNHRKTLAACLASVLDGIEELDPVGADQALPEAEMRAYALLLKASLLSPWFPFSSKCMWVILTRCVLLPCAVRRVRGKRRCSQTTPDPLATRSLARLSVGAERIACPGCSQAEQHPPTRPFNAISTLI